MRMAFGTSGIAHTVQNRTGSTSMGQARVPAGWWFWPRWVLVSAVAWTVGLAILAETPAYEVGIVRSGDPSDTSGWGVAWAVILGGLLCGALLGGVQRLLLRRHLARLGGWTLVSTAGFTLGYTVVWALGGAGYGEAYGHHALPHGLDGAGLPGGALLGAAFGAAQWLVLRRRVARAGWWVPANILGFAAGSALAAALPVDDVPAHFVGGAVLGAILGAVTGGALLWLLAQAPRPTGAHEPTRAG